MLNNDDKKYLKENIEKRLDNLDKKVGNVSKSKGSANIDTSTPSGKRLNELLSQDREKENRKQLLAELQKKNENGEATLAQKIEMMNLSLKTAIPDDFKEAVKDSGKILKDVGKDVKRGTNRALGGVDSIITRMMGMNPLTAMLWSAGKDITRDLWNIGAGAAQAGWGIAKGVGRGAVNIGKGVGSIFNSAVNLFKPKPKKEEDVPEDEKQVEGSRPLLESGEEFEEKDAEKSTAQKIDEIHQAFFKDFKKHLNDSEKTEKSRTSILSKGLSGIGKSMQAVSGIVNTIMAKQKLILGGLMLGALGILALVGWFKNGGLTKALSGLFPDAAGGGDGSTFIPEKISTDDLDGGLYGDAWKNAVTTKVNNGDFGKIKHTEHNDLTLGTWKHGDKPSKKGLQSFRFEAEDDKEMVILAPFDCYIKEVQFCTHKNGDKSLGYGNEKGYYRIYIEKVHTKKQGQGDVSWSQYEYCVYPVFDPKFSEQPRTQDKHKSYKVVKKGTILGYAHGYYYIVPHDKGSYQHFEASLGQYVMDSNSEFKKGYSDSINKTGEFRTENDAKAVRKMTVDNAQSLKYSKNWDEAQGFWEKVKTGAAIAANEFVQFLGGNAYNDFMYDAAAPNNLGKGDNVPQSNNTKNTFSKITESRVPNNNYNQGNTNDNKVQKQKDDLAAQEKAEQERLNKEIEKGLNESPYESKPQNVSLNVSQNTPSQAAEIFNIGQYDAATS